MPSRLSVTGNSQLCPPWGSFILLPALSVWQTVHILIPENDSDCLILGLIHTSASGLGEGIVTEIFTPWSRRGWFPKGKDTLHSTQSIFLE